jgi:cytochrome c oxidase cbb3-type subunit 3
VVNDGVPAKGMIAWGQQLPRNDVLAVALFAYSLRGTTPMSPKDPQGDPIPAESGHGSFGAP